MHVKIQSELKMLRIGARNLSFLPTYVNVMLKNRIRIDILNISDVFCMNTCGSTEFFFMTM